MSLKWWEKTVEYEFVLRVAKEKHFFLAPLDGAHEIAGDAIFSSKNRWILIEFKKDASAITTEKTKFTDYKKAYEALSLKDRHHHLIYGKENTAAPSRLCICAQTYFSGTTCAELKEVLASGTEYEVFKEYVAKYIAFKKPPSGGGGAVASLNDLTLVAGVNTDNNTVCCLSLSEFQQQLGIAPKLERRMSRGPSL